METLVIKVLKKYFKLFIKNFKAEQLSVYAAKGEGQMTDLELSESVIQELLYIPMNLTVTKAACDLLTLKIPWTSLSSKPVVLTLNRVDIDLREPEKIEPPPSALKKLTDKKKKNERSDVMDNAQLVVNSVHITIQTLGGNLVMIDLDDIMIQSTNGQWQVVDLNQSRIIDKDLGIENMYKKLTVRAITMAVLTEKSAHMILQQMPLQILLTQKRRIKDIALLGAEIEFVLEDVKFRWTRPEWLIMVELGRGFQQCLSRPVPEEPPTLPTTPGGTVTIPTSPSGTLLPPITSPDVSFKVRLDKWSFDFIESMEKDIGYSFFGQGLVTVFNSTKTNLQRVPNDKTGEIISTEVDETVISVMISTVNFRELLPRDHIRPYIVSSKDQTNVNQAPQAGQYLLKGNFILRRPAEADSSTKYVPLIGLELSLALSNLQIVADRKVWKRLIRFLSIPLTPKETEEEKQKAKERELNKEKEFDETLAAAQTSLAKLKDTLKLGENWFSQIKLNIKASDIRLVLPQERKGLYQNVHMHLDLGSFIMGNFSDWKVTPNLSKGIALLAAPSPAPPVGAPNAIGVPQKLTFQIEGVSVALHASGRVSNILAPTGVKLFVHYYEKETKIKEKGKPNLEVIFQSGEFNLQANAKQFAYLAFIGRKYLNPRKIKSALTVQVEQVTEVATNKIKEAVKEAVEDFQKTLPKEDMVTPIRQKVQSALDEYKWIVYIHFNKGIFRVPLQFLLAPDPEPAAATPAPAIMETPLTPLTPVVEVETSIEDLLSSKNTDLCEIKYEHMDLAFENNINGQGVVIQLGAFQATGIDYPGMGSIITLLPLRVTDEEKNHYVQDVESLVFRYKRRRKHITSDDPSPDEEYTVDVWVRLQGMQVKLSSKPDQPADAGMGLPDIQDLVNKAVALIQERKSDIDLIRENAKHIDFGVKWGVEVGNCEVLLEEIEKDGVKSTGVYKPYGVVRLSDAQRHSLAKNYVDLEDQLVKAKTSLAMKENEKEDMVTKISSLQNALLTLEADKVERLKKITDEFTALEAKFVQAKITIAQHQMDNDNLKSQISRLSKGK